MFLLTLFADVNDGNNSGSWLWTILIILAIIALAIYIVRRVR
jgi:flagellar biogenesis protein FliO